MNSPREQIARLLREQPLIGLALAVASGILLAHFAIKGVDVAYESYFENNPLEASVALFAAVVVIGCAYRFRRLLLDLIGRHRWKLSISLIFIFAVSIYITHRLRVVEEGNRFVDQVEASGVDAAMNSAQSQSQPRTIYDDIADEDLNKKLMDAVSAEYGKQSLSSKAASLGLRTDAGEDCIRQNIKEMTKQKNLVESGLPHNREWNLILKRMRD